VVVLGNRDELIRVFENLIENALKYGASGKRVEIDFTRDEKPEGPEVRVGVRDYGPGIAPEHLPRLTERFYRVDVADSRAQALKDAGPYTLYFFHTLFSHGNLYNVGGQRQSGYVREEGLGWLRPENREDFLRALQGFRKMTAEDLTRNERLCWGSPAQVRDQLIALAEALGSNVLLLQFNQGAMPHDMFMNQIRRFSTEVLPDLRRHTVTKPVAV